MNEEFERILFSTLFLTFNLPKTDINIVFYSFKPNKIIEYFSFKNRIIKKKFMKHYIGKANNQCYCYL